MRNVRVIIVQYYWILLLIVVPNYSSFAQPSQALRQRVDEIVAKFLMESSTARSSDLITHQEKPNRGTSRSKLLPQNHGLMVGIIDEGYFYQYAYGTLLPNTSAPPDSSTMFGIGSVTKNFTITLLQALVMQKKVHLDDPVAIYLPDSIAKTNPYWQTVTLRHLATYTANLPKDPDNLADTYTDSNNPYQHYGVADMLHFIRHFTPKKIGIGNENKENVSKNNKTNFEKKGAHRNLFIYSHINIVLLSYCLEQASGRTYAQLLEQYIFQPINMKNTTILPNEMQVEQQLARGLTFNGQPYPPIHWGEVPSAEGLYSTCADMLRYVNAYLMADTQHICTMINRPIAATNVKNVHTAGGWFLFRRNKNSPTVLTHSGCNGGYACYIAFEPRRKVGIVLMANIDQNLDNLGIMLLDFLLR